MQNSAELSRTAALKEPVKEPLQAAHSARNRNPEAMIPIESKKVCPSCLLSALLNCIFHADCPRSRLVAVKSSFWSHYCDSWLC